jgi:hypothetical protein
MRNPGKVATVSWCIDAIPCRDNYQVASHERAVGLVFLLAAVYCLLTGLFPLEAGFGGASSKPHGLVHLLTADYQLLTADYQAPTRDQWPSVSMAST